MRSKADTLAFFLALLTTTLASPTSTPPPVPMANTTNPASFIPGRRNKACWGYTFRNEGSAASPLDEDCKRLIANIANDGVWEVEAAAPLRQHQLAQWGTCAFGVEKDNESGDLFYYVGNDDIIHILESAMALWGSDKVGAKGWMSCSALIEPPTIKWGIYHT